MLQLSKILKRLYVRKLFQLLFILSLVQINLCALDDVDLEFEVGMFNASFAGDISNNTNAVTFDNDLGYDETSSSFFSLKAKFDNEYIPVMRFNYLNFSEDSSAALTGQKIGENFFNETVNTSIKYRVFNSIFYYEFKAKGKKKRMFGKARYTGDFEIDLGLNFKNIDYSYNMVGTSSNDIEYIRVKSSILLPFLAMRYYLYNLSVFADISTLSFSDIKATSYNFGIDYQMIQNLYLGLTFFYEDFEETIAADTIRFESSGLMYSVKYAF
jgi:hypothetical protein